MVELHVHQCYGGVVGVDVKAEVAQTRDVGLEHVTARGENQPVVAVCNSVRRRDGARLGVDCGDLGGDVRNSGGVEHIGERNATGAQIRFVIANPDVVKWLGAQHSNLDRARRGGELVESPGGPERSPQTGEPGADHYHVGQWLNT